MDDLFLTILNMSLTGAFVIAAICLARLPLKKAPKIISYCLWAVAGFRLVFPFSIESIFSLIPFKAQTIPKDIAMQYVPRIDSGIPIIDNAISAALPAVEHTANVNTLQMWITIGSWVWLIGASTMLIYAIVSYFLLKRKMRGSAQIDGSIFESASIQSPFVLGVFRPRIFLPLGLSEREREYIILHEQTHVRRHDHIIKFAAYFILCLHWFNPLAWVAFLLMGVDMEMSCDERVLKEMGSETKTDYSMSLLSLATERRVIGGSPLAFGEGGVKERVKNVLNFKKQSRVIIIASVLLVAVLSVGFASNRVTEAGTPLQEITGATHSQAEQIELHLAEFDISYQTIAYSNNPIIEGMDANFQAYDLITEDGDSYVLILRKSDNDFTALLDAGGILISGFVDNGVTPALFINGKYDPHGNILGTIENEDGILLDGDRAVYVKGRKAVHMTIDGFGAWVDAGKSDAEVYDYAECVIYTPIGSDLDEMMYLTIDDYKAWASTGENDADVYDFASQLKTVDMLALNPKEITANQQAED